MTGSRLTTNANTTTYGVSRSHRFSTEPKSGAVDDDGVRRSAARRRRLSWALRNARERREGEDRGDWDMA